MSINVKNIFADIPANLVEEEFKEIQKSGSFRMERIVSKGHVSPEEEWYDQSQSEWVMVLEGAARIVFEGEQEVCLKKGDYINIPAHTRHKVTWTDPELPTVWLAIHY